ncbi:hypothetical protein V2H45_10555 [Tumidithrix elongata RA019]|uniref:SPOR domain-containing protein n=1 Tax=Tumidithrix elongata BACA0141 TaxID=2716417 RepID=A0AAW9PS81_9CYAN|nr:hypothetical protein [Tumidithrix elongata RA019]
MKGVQQICFFGSGFLTTWALLSGVAHARYVVFVPSNSPTTLQSVRSIAPSAFSTVVQGQSAVQAGIFNNESGADSLVRTLQQAGLPAQKFFRSGGGKEPVVQTPFPETQSTQAVVPQPTQVTPVADPVQYTTISDTQQISQQYYPQPQVPQQVSTQYLPQVAPQTITQLVPQTVTQYVPQTQYVQQTQLVPQTVTQLVPQTQYVPQTQVVPQTVTQYVPQTQIVQQAQYVPQTQITSQAIPQTQMVQSSCPQVDCSATMGNMTPIAYSNPSTIGGDTTSSLSQANPANRYVTAVPAAGNGASQLAKVRQYIPSAYLANSGRGSYVYAGGYASRDNAESLSHFLRSRGIDARVIYF